MAITASTISSTQTLEEFRLEFNKLRSDVSTLESPTFGASITFEGATDDSYETTLTVTDPTADRTITLPNATGTVLLSGNVAVTDLDIDGGTDIGAAIVAADLFVVDDGAGGTNRKTAASRIKTFVEASAMAVTGNVTATGTIEPAGDTSSGDNAAMGYTSDEGLILTGQGIAHDVTIKNDADTNVITVATGTTNVDVVGDLTAGTLNADGDTAAGDNAAIGYTSAEGLILTGQGSTSDITIKNDADAAVITVATGTTNVDVVGDLTAESFNLPITLNGTDGSSTDAGDNIILDASASGTDVGERLLYEGIPPDETMGSLILTGPTAFGGNTLTNFSEVAAAAINTSTAATVPSDTNVVRYSLTGNATITLPASQPAAAAAVKTIVLYFKQDGTGSRTMALAAPGGESISYNNSSSQPTVNATASKVTLYTCMKFDSDTVWYVSQSYIDD